MDCRYPEHREVNLARPPWPLGVGIPCRNDGLYFMLWFKMRIAEAKAPKTAFPSWSLGTSKTLVIDNMISLNSVFISYQTIDKMAAARLKNELSRIGITSFLAHEDIEVSEDWKTKILDELKDAELFVCLLSENYLKSHWCVQESGIAAFRSNLFVVPLSFDGTTPMGFLGSIQSVKVIPECISLTDIAPALLKGNTKKGLSTLVELIGASQNYRDAEANFAVIFPVLHQIDSEQGKRLLDISCSNCQIHDAVLCAKTYIPKAIEFFGHLISAEQREFLISTCKRYRAQMPKDSQGEFFSYFFINELL